MNSEALVDGYLWALVATITVEALLYAWPLRLGWRRGVALFLGTNLSVFVAMVIGGVTLIGLVSLGEWAAPLSPWLSGGFVVGARAVVFCGEVRPWGVTGWRFGVGLAATMLSGVAVSLFVLAQIALMMADD